MDTPISCQQRAKSSSFIKPQEPCSYSYCIGTQFSPKDVYCWTAASPKVRHFDRSSATGIHCFPAILARSSIHIYMYFLSILLYDVIGNMVISEPLLLLNSETFSHLIIRIARPFRTIIVYHGFSSSLNVLSYWQNNQFAGQSVTPYNLYLTILLQGAMGSSWLQQEKLRFY